MLSCLPRYLARFDRDADLAWRGLCPHPEAVLLALGLRPGEPVWSDSISGAGNPLGLVACGRAGWAGASGDQRRPLGGPWAAALGMPRAAWPGGKGRQELIFPSSSHAREVWDHMAFENSFQPRNKIA